MQLMRCPHCHARIDLHSCVEDEATRELLALVARTPRPLAAVLLQYLTLFRAANRDLTNSRALALAEGALALTSDQYLLAGAMRDTVETMQARRGSGESRPLKNHNYLKQVLGSVAEREAKEVPKGRVRLHGESAPEPVRRKETPEEADRAWRARMTKLGVDPDELIAPFLKNKGTHGE
jgi:hypothetical protein